MTVQDLNQLRCLSKEVQYLEKKFDESVKCVHSSKKEIETLKCLIKKRKRKIYKIDKYIHCIPDSYIRMIFSLKYEKGISWLQVAMRLGGGNTADNVRQKVYRYLKKENEVKNINLDVEKVI